jgi:uncharacterized coiled-coil protein SlyX
MDVDAAPIRQDLVEANSRIADTELRIARQGEVIAELFAGGHSTKEAEKQLTLLNEKLKAIAAEKGENRWRS